MSPGTAHLNHLPPTASAEEIAAHLGEILWAKGERDEALKVWRNSLLENPGNETLVSVMKKFAP